MNVKIFVSYSHRDREYVTDDSNDESLLGFLKGLVRDGDVSFWFDKDLSAGTKWDTEIKAQIAQCHIALVLVSQSFLDSSYCIDVEISGFLERCRTDGMRVLPVVLSPCEWEQHAWLAERQFLPGGQETIEEHYSEPGKRKRLYLRIRKELRAMIEQVRKAQTEAPPSEELEPVAQRRIVTLLHCSLVPTNTDGNPLDQEDLLELLYEVTPEFKVMCCSQIERLKGHIIDEENAGGILACFGYPTALEDASVRAVRAALSIAEATAEQGHRIEQNWGTRIDARTGIHTGLVITTAGADTSDQLQRGETPKTAILLQSRAPAGAVLISQDTEQLVQDFFDLEEGDTIEDPSLSKPVAQWRVLNDLDVPNPFDPTRLRGLTPMVGRKKELGLVLDRWKAAQQGKGHAVVVTAEAGVGKSRLLVAIKESIEENTHQLAVFRCSPYHENTALYPVIQTLTDWIGIEEKDPPETQLTKLEAALSGFEFSLEELLPVLAGLLSIPLDDRYVMPEMSPRQQKEFTLEAVTSLLLERALKTPVLIVIEDLHWMDPSTAEWLDILVQQVATVPILLVCSTRPQYTVPAHWQSLNYFVPITLGQLTREEINKMVCEITGGKALPPEIMSEIYKKTEGYPLFIEDLTRMVIESDLVKEQESIYVLSTRFQSLSIPATLQETLLVRLSQLEGARTVAQLGATIGREFTFEMHRAISGLNDAVLKEELQRLVSIGLMYKRGLLSRATYIFKHALVQEALYESLLKRERKRYHQLIAQVIEERFPNISATQPELLARHYDEAGSPAQAVEYWIRAGEQATRESANVEAINHATNALKALQKLPEGPERRQRELRLQTMQGPALLAIKGWAAPEIGAAFARARELCEEEGNTPKLFQIDRGLWGYYMVSAQLDSSIELAEELMRMADEEQNKDYRLEAHACFCDSYFWMGKPALAYENARLGLAIYNPEKHHTHHALEYGEDPSSIFLCYSGIALWMLGYPDKAKAIVARAKTDLEAYTHLFSRGFVLNGLAWHYVHTQNPPEAEKYGKALMDLSTEHDFPPWLALAKTQYGWAIGAQGRVDEGIQEILAGMAEWKGAGAVVTTALNYTLLVDVYQRAGRYEEAMAYAEEGLAHAASVEENHYWSELHRLKGELLLQLNRSAVEAEACFQESLRIARDQKARALELRALLSLARLWHHDHPDELRRQLEAVYETYTEGLDSAELVRTRALLDDLNAPHSIKASEAHPQT